MHIICTITQLSEITGNVAFWSKSAEQLLHLFYIATSHVTVGYLWRAATCTDCMSDDVTTNTIKV